MTPIPPLNKVYALLLQEESQRLLTFSVDSVPFSQDEAVACIAKQANKDKRKCSHCGYTGHTIDKCFQIIGYPPNWKGPKGPRKAPQNDSSKPKANSVINDASIEKEDSDAFNPDLYRQFMAFVKLQSANSTPSAAVALRASELSSIPDFSGPPVQSTDWLC